MLIMGLKGLIDSMSLQEPKLKTLHMANALIDAQAGVVLSQ